MKHSQLDFWVGIFILLGILAVVFLSLRVANQTTIRNGDTYEISAEFDNVGGLKLRAPVKSAGVTVGRVTKIYLDPTSYKAVVELAVEKRYAFSTDAAASILTAGLLGEQYISLQNGADTEKLNDGDSIWLTSSAIILENLVSEFMFNAVSQPK